jgi:hypothetical protein
MELLLLHVVDQMSVRSGMSRSELDTAEVTETLLAGRSPGGFSSQQSLEQTLPSERAPRSPPRRSWPTMTFATSAIFSKLRDPRKRSSCSAGCYLHDSSLPLSTAPDQSQSGEGTDNGPGTIETGSSPPDRPKCSLRVLAPPLTSSNSPLGRCEPRGPAPGEVLQV